MGLILVYSVIAITVLGSLGAGIALTGFSTPQLGGADWHGLIVASR